MKTPMFPLGSAFLPGEPVPLRVFESRYIAMARDLLAADTDLMRFGTVLISRGSEVGGSDERRSYGVHVVVDRMSATEETGYAILGIATEVIRVDEWLEDDPYPRARVSVIDDKCASSIASLASRTAVAAQRARLVIQQICEVEGVVVDDGWNDPLARTAAGQWISDATEDSLRTAVWLVARSLPVGAEDRFGFLSAPTVDERVRRVEEAIAHIAEIAAFRQGGTG